MIRNIANGFMWGIGFSISTSIVLSLWLVIALPKLLSSETSAMEISQNPETETETETETFPRINDFDELSLDEKIANSTAIIVAKIEKNDAGKYQSRVSEILKKQENVDLYHEVGQIYENELPYFDEFESLNRDVPEGFIVFMSENPARMRYSVSYSGGRVGSLGNISLALLRQKCAP